MNKKMAMNKIKDYVKQYMLWHLSQEMKQPRNMNQELAKKVHKRMKFFLNGANDI